MTLIGSFSGVVEGSTSGSKGNERQEINARDKSGGQGKSS